MLENSKDLLNLTIAFCILWLTVFICWLIYYFAMILRGVHLVIERFNQALEAVTGFFTKAGDRFESLTSGFSSIMDAAKKISDFVAKKKKPQPKKE